MKNKKGFTIIELGVSICLVTIVALLLFQIINTVKKVYTASDIKTTLLTKQAIMTKKIYDDFDSKTISQITSCNEWQNSCLQFIFTDNSKSILSVDPLKMVIKYGNYSINFEEIDDTISFGELYFDKEDTFFTIKIPISSKSVSGDYGIYITKQHSGFVTNTYTEVYDTITVPLYDKDGNSTSTIIKQIDGSYWMNVYDADNSLLNTLMSPNLKRLKLETCSNSNDAGTVNVYELKTDSDSSRWCQSNNFYTQNVGNYYYVDGYINTALGKNTYVDALTSTSTLNDTKLDLKVNEFINRYTFKLR